MTEIVFGEINSYLLVAIPLFAFMAHVMIRGKIVDDLYDTAYTLTRHLPGGLGIATIAACTIFAAISGSSVATALTIGAVAIPQMIKFGYEPRVAYGLVAAGGTLGILIPPSGPMVLYGVAADTSIGALFMAGVLPGLMMAAIFVAWMLLSTGIAHRHIRREPRATLREAAVAVRKSLWAVSLPVFVLGGMYAGIFTTTEAAGAGALLALFGSLFGLQERRLEVDMGVGLGRKPYLGNAFHDPRQCRCARPCPDQDAHSAADCCQRGGDRHGSNRFSDRVDAAYFRSRHVP